MADCTASGSVTHRHPVAVARQQHVMSDGYACWYRHYEPQSRPRAYVVALHGIQSHSGWYEASSSHLATCGMDVRFLDRRGSGENDHDRGHVVHADRLVNDVRQFLEQVRFDRDMESPTAPVVLLGLSWGGRLAAVCAARSPQIADGLCLLYPGIEARFRPNLIQRWLLNLACAAGLERKPRRIPVDDPRLFTSSLEWQRYIAEDSLTLREATLGFLQAGEQIAREARRDAERIILPAFLALAGRDEIIDNAATLRWFHRLSSPHQVLTRYPLAAHTLEFEHERDAFLADLTLWLETLIAHREIATGSRGAIHVPQ